MLWSHIDKVVYLPMSQMFFLENFKVEGCKDCVSRAEKSAEAFRKQKFKGICVPEVSNR